MTPDRQADGGVEPTPDPGPPDREPLYKFGDSGTRLQSLLHTVIVVVLAFIAANVLVLAVLQAGAATGLISITGPVDSLADLPTEVTVAVFATNFIGFFLVGLAYLRWRGESPFASTLYRIDVPSLRDIGWVVGGLFGLFVVLSLLSVVAAQFGVQASENVSQSLGEGNPQLFLYLIPIALLLNGPAEEFLFRGIVQGLFRDAYGVLPGVVLSAVVFGVVHFLAISGGNVVVTLAIISLLGIGLGALYEWSNNLVVPGLVHGLFNAIQYGALYVSTTGAA
jgi:hypothetical protein